MKRNVKFNQFSCCCVFKKNLSNMKIHYYDRLLNHIAQV